VATRLNAVVYRSRVDLWLLLPLALVVAVPLWTMLGTCYTLSDEALRVRSGPFTWRIALIEVSGIELTRDACSSPALSLDRLRIDYGDGRSLSISPADKQRFVRDFTARRARAPT